MTRENSVEMVVEAARNGWATINSPKTLVAPGSAREEAPTIPARPEGAAAPRRKRHLPQNPHAKLRKATARWLATNDRPSSAKKFIDGKRKERARRQSRAMVDSVHRVPRRASRP